MYTIQIVQKTIGPTRPGHIACTACTDLAISRNREAMYMHLTCHKKKLRICLT